LYGLPPGLRYVGGPAARFLELGQGVSTGAVAPGRRARCSLRLGDCDCPNDSPHVAEKQPHRASSGDLSGQCQHFGAASTSGFTHRTAHNGMK
jgi:hypothetical protein